MSEPSDERAPRREPTSRDRVSYGFPRRLWQAVERHPPPGMGRTRAWRSPLRGPWLTAILGLVLLVGLPVVIITGLLSYIAYGPQFGQAIPVHIGGLQLPGFDWPTRPSWLYRLTQGVHVDLGLVLIPVLLAKLWSVLPRLFAWPPARSFAQVLERLSLLLLVGGVLFEFATGVLNIQYDYVFGFSFYTAHYYGAWVFIGAFVVHVVLKLPVMLRALRSRSLRSVLRTTRADTAPEPPDLDGLVALDPAPSTISRRGAIGLVGGGAAMIAVLSVGQSIGGPARRLAVLLPRGRSAGSGPNGFQVNKTAAAAGIQSSDVGPGWRLRLSGGGIDVALDRAALSALPQHSATLSIPCVEGWATDDQVWTGVRLLDLARLAGVPRPGSAHVSSIQRGGAFGAASLQANQVLDAQALLALKVNGVDLSMDHGYPARVIVPGLPGVHNTKWVGAIVFETSEHG